MGNFLQRINKITLKFLTPLTLEETYSLVCKEAITFLGVDHASIYLKQNGNLKKVYATLPELYNVVAKKRGLTYKAFNTRRVYVAHVKDFEKFYPQIKKMKIKSSIFIPLSYHRKTTGVLVLQSLVKKSFRTEELHTFEILGSVASLAIRKAQLNSETLEAIKSRNQSKEMENILDKVNKAGLNFLVPLTPKETYSIIVREALKLVEAQHGSILIEQSGSLQRVYSTSPILYRIIPRRRGFLYKAFRSRKPIIIPAKEVEKIHPEFQKLQASSNIVVPLSYRNKSIGVLTAQSFLNKNFAKKDLSILKLFSPLASLAIRKTQLYDETKKALRVRDLFIALAAHELRTPLTTLNGYIQLLNNKFANKRTPEAGWIKQLTYESTRMTHLVKDLLEINKMQAGQLHYSFKECSLREIINKAKTNFSFSYPDRVLILEDKIKETTDVVIADFGKLIQVLDNVLNNAAKFSPGSLPVVLRLEADASNFIIKIIDEGRGISKEDLNKIFQLFYKGVSNMQEGLGLGLSLSKNIIEHHQGNISVQSEVNRGTIVEIKLPIAQI